MFEVWLRGVDLNSVSALILCKLCADPFPRRIRKVYADATYQYIRKGQPLFTIYSPDLVTTEQEYLLAKKNSEQVRTSTVSGVSTGAQALLSAARERLTQW